MRKGHYSLDKFNDDYYQNRERYTAMELDRDFGRRSVSLLYLPLQDQMGRSRREIEPLEWYFAQQ